MVTMAARISKGWLLLDSSEGLGRALEGALHAGGHADLCNGAWMIAACAWLSDTPGGRLKLRVEAGKPLWWLTCNGVLVLLM